MYTLLGSPLKIRGFIFNARKLHTHISKHQMKSNDNAKILNRKKKMQQLNLTIFISGGMGCKWI